jgi:hypothetical protein
VLLAEHHEVINAFTANRANQPLGKTVLPWRPSRNRLVADPHRSQPAPDNVAIKPVPITDQILWRFIPREGLTNLPRDPFGSRLRRHIDPDKLSPSQPNNDEGVEQIKGNRRHHKHIHGGNLRRMVAQKGRPALTGGAVAPLPRHIFGDS